ncbi:hypothetical protein EBESD8_25070 [Rhodococcus aetherivorans]|nr:hypothetical protein EBESD8_25070 [Rhodococcus aetherivorans]
MAFPRGRQDVPLRRERRTGAAPHRDRRRGLGRAHRRPGQEPRRVRRDDAVASLDRRGRPRARADAAAHDAGVLGPDALLHRDMAASFPDVMHLDVENGGYRWRNDLLGIDQWFVPGDSGTLPEHPLVFIGCQLPDDVLLVTERDGHLWFDAALVTSSADWSVKFDIGMSLHEIHRPVPGLTPNGVTDRAEQFMRRLTTERPYRRVNWTFSAVGSRRRDTSLETMPEWMDDMPQLIAERDWGRIQLRIELEHLIRLPMTGALVFNIRTYMAPLEEIAQVPAWAEQLADIVEELPAEIAAYKGIDSYRMPAMAWLRERTRARAA